MTEKSKSAETISPTTPRPTLRPVAGEKLAGGRSSKWAFMEKFEVPDLDHPAYNYLTRWRIIQTPWFALYLHRLDGPDSRETLHDHPFAFVSLVLRGGYFERRLDPKTLEVDEDHRVRRINVAPKGMVHSIKALTRFPTWTLLFVGRRYRTWGYIEPIKDGYQWVRFDRHLHATEFEAAMRARRRLGHW